MVRDRYMAGAPHSHLPIMDGAELQDRLPGPMMTVGTENLEARLLVTLGSKNSMLLWVVY